MKEVKQKKSKAQKSVPDKIFVVLNTLFMIAFVVITLYPVLNTLAISLNDGTDALRGGIYLLPRKFTMKNYNTVLQKNNLLTGAYITVLELYSERLQHCLLMQSWLLLSAESASYLNDPYRYSGLLPCM